MRDSRTARLTEGTVIAGKYRLDRLLTRGGMGVLWVAQHIELEEPVAIKFMDLSHSDARTRFAREAKSTAQLRSPHVVQILDYGVEGEVVYIVMELLEGEDLRVRLKRRRRLPLATVAMIADQVSKTLHLAHKRGIVHRDLKPANIFMARIDEDEIVKILDFGIVKAMGGGTSVHKTKSGMLIGSPNYMSPEQARGSPDIDHRTDLWSLGLVLFEALTGKKAFLGDSVFDVIMKICSAPIPVPSACAPDLPRELDAFFSHALQRHPERRFASAREMGAEFMSVIRSIGVEATTAALQQPIELSPVDQDFSPGDQSQSQSQSSSTSSVEISSQEIVVVKDHNAKGGRRRTSHGTLEMSTLGGGPRNLPIPLVERKAGADPSVSLSRSELPRASSAPTPARLSQEKPASAEEKRPQSPLVLLMRNRPDAEPRPIARSSPDLEPRPIARPSPDTGPRPIAKSSPDAEPRPIAKSSPGVEPRPIARSSPDAEPRPTAKSSPDAEPRPTAQSSPDIPARPLPKPTPRGATARDIDGYIDSAFAAMEGINPAAKAPEGAGANLGEQSPPSKAPNKGPLPKEAPAGADEQGPTSRSLKEPTLFTRLVQGKEQAPSTGAKGLARGRSRAFSTGSQKALQAGGGKAAPKNDRATVAQLVDQGFAALKSGDPERAKRCWKEALLLDPSNRALELNLRKLEAKSK